MSKRTKIILLLIGLNSTAAVLSLLTHHLFYGSLGFSTVEKTISVWMGLSLGMVIGVLVTSKELK